MNKDDRIAVALSQTAMDIAAEEIAKAPDKKEEIVRRLAAYEPVKPAKPR